MLVHIDAPQNLRGGASHRVAPALGGLEIHARDSEAVDGELLARGEVAREIDELFFLRKAFGDLLRVKPGQGLFQLESGLGGVDHLARVGIERGGGERDRENLTVAIGNRRPLH